MVAEHSHDPEWGAEARKGTGKTPSTLGCALCVVTGDEIAGQQDEIWMRCVHLVNNFRQSDWLHTPRFPDECPPAVQSSWVESRWHGQKGGA